MGEKSEILDALTKMSTGTILACILGVQIYLGHTNDQQWNERLESIMERQAAAVEKNGETVQNLADALILLVEND